MSELRRRASSGEKKASSAEKKALNVQQRTNLPYHESPSNPDSFNPDSLNPNSANSVSTTRVIRVSDFLANQPERNTNGSVNSGFTAFPHRNVWKNTGISLSIYITIFPAMLIGVRAIFFFVFLAQEASRNDLEARAVIFPKFEPVASHGDPF